MVEPIMFFGIGFLVAGLFGLILVPLVHGRAVRLTMRRLEADTPLSMAEIQADKDQLRAEFAMSTRRLEMSVEQLKAKSTSQLGELAKKSEAINRLKIELGEKTAAIFALEAREKALKDQLRSTEQEYAVKNNILHENERALADKEAELAKLLSELGEKTVTTDSQRVEITSLRTQVDALKAQVERCERDIGETADRLHVERAAATAATKELSNEHGKVENLGARLGEFQHQLVTQTAEAEILGRRVHDLELRLADQGRLLVERDYELTQLRPELETARNTDRELRAELAAIEGRHRGATESLHIDKGRLENELEQARADSARLQQEIVSMQRAAEESWASERVENAMLRERINDIAAEVARLTVALEGPGSPIEALLGPETAQPRVAVVNGPARAADDADDRQGDLADRIRALQVKASRISPVSESA